MSSKLPSFRRYTGYLFEISLKQRKLLVVTIYQSPDQNLDYFLSSVMVVLEYCLQLYNIFIILGDFDQREHNPKMQSFSSQQGYKYIIKNKICFKSLERSCIDLILTSRPNLHPHTQVFE